MQVGSDNPFQKPLALLYSVLLHGTVVGCCLWASTWKQADRTEAADSLTPQEMKRVIWFDARTNLPSITPDWKQREPQTKKGNSAQAISAKPKNPQKSEQFVVLPEAPKLAQIDLPAPDLLKMAVPAAPERPKLKPFQAPAMRPKTQAAAAVVDMPAVAAPAPKVEMPNLLKTVVVPERPKPKAFQPPPSGGPSAGQVKAETATTIVDPLPLPTGQAALPATGAVEALIVNKNPANTLPQFPEGNRRGQLDTGTPQGSGAATATGSGLLVPDLSVKGALGVGAGLSSGGPIAEGGKSSAPGRGPEPAAHKFTRILLPRMQAGVSVAYWPGARTLGAAIERRFPNRVAYVTVIGAPPGFPTLDWVLWFAETTATDPGLRPVMRPPTMVSAAVPGGGPMQLGRKLPAGGFLRKTGHIDSLAILDPEADSPVARSYLEAIEESTFLPATHNGQPVDVEVFLEISPVPTYDRKPLK